MSQGSSHDSAAYGALLAPAGWSIAKPLNPSAIVFILDKIMRLCLVKVFGEVQAEFLFGAVAGVQISAPGGNATMAPGCGGYGRGLLRTVNWPGPALWFGGAGSGDHGRAVGPVAAVAWPTV